MRLSAKALVNYANINNFAYANQWIIRAGEINILYFQLFDLDQGPQNAINGPIFGSNNALAGNVGLRYMTGVGTANQPVGLVVTFPSIDSSQAFSVIAQQADPTDASIFKITLSSMQSPNSGNVFFALTEGNNTRRFFVQNMISVEYPAGDGGCGCDGTLPSSAPVYG